MICEMQLLILHCKENELCIDVYHKQSLLKKMSLLQLQHVMIRSMWFLTSWHIVMICEILLKVMQFMHCKRKSIVHWCLS